MVQNPKHWRPFSHQDLMSATPLELLAMELAGSVEDRETLLRALRRVGATCSGCHEDYRLNRD